ncbi:FkbM family methyltransferase [Kordiimonas marina]|uniref:FkbM family methyltransferase n=1 Tax=Kordiimonas marina TaxID=2872312 RepID=UPI001FF37BF0|nr:FkbM family methyltransferase [Kordiimonas marina]MCJ9429973.1 FkbM family methyltransferase [Kordiimonas marina]
MNADMAVVAPIDKQEARAWVPWRKGPDQMVLRCTGSLLSRLAYGAYLHWPLPRGRRSLLRLLGRLPFISSHITSVPFRSAFGGACALDMTSAEFHYLSGFMPAEPLEVMLMTRLVDKDDVFVDVGANVGLYVIHILGLMTGGKAYYALEPDPDNFSFLRRTCGSPDQLNLIQAGASDHKGSATLTRTNSLEGTLEATETAGQGTVSVDILRIDDLLKDLTADQKIVLKIDVEGHEPSVIRGMSGLVGRGILPIMQIEYLPESAGGKRHLIDAALEETFGDKLAFYAIANDDRLLYPIDLKDEIGPEALNILALPHAETGRIDRIFAKQ